MTKDTPDAPGDAFRTNNSFEETEDGFVSTTSTFEGITTVNGTDGQNTVYTVTVTVPTLDGATADEVGEVVVTDWFETLERRLEGAPKATRVDVELDSFGVERDGEAVHIEYIFGSASPERAADIAKTFVEYVEGTYVEGIVPGYEYEQPVSELLSRASQSGESGTPL